MERRSFFATIVGLALAPLGAWLKVKPTKKPWSPIDHFRKGGEYDDDAFLEYLDKLTRSSVSPEFAVSRSVHRPSQWTVVMVYVLIPYRRTHATGHWQNCVMLDLGETFKSQKSFELAVHSWIREAEEEIRRAAAEALKADEAYLTRRGEMESREVHNLEVAGSIPAVAT